MSATALLEIDRLSVRFGTSTVVDGVSFSIAAGEKFGLVGESGSGKSITALSILRLVDAAQSSGAIRFDGEDLMAKSEREMRGIRGARIGMIFQRPNPFPLSIRRNLDMPLQEHGFKNKADRERRIEQALRDVGLWHEVSDRLDAPALGLSGGQQQRLCIARALVLEPEILLMDEPCSALDPISSGVVEDLIARLGGRYTVIIVTHNLAQARRIANYTAFFWMQDQIGQLIEYGACQQLFDAPAEALTAAYINGTRG
mgnify:CR=1 FL=1